MRVFLELTGYVIATSGMIVLVYASATGKGLPIALIAMLVGISLIWLMELYEEIFGDYRDFDVDEFINYERKSRRKHRR